MRRLTLLAVLLAVVVSISIGQEFRATISGHVYDSSGGRVPSAKVEAINVATNEVATATTDTSGAYSIPALRPGQYRVVASAAGFKQVERPNVVVEVGRTVGIDITLEVGQVSETVTVSAELAGKIDLFAARGMFAHFNHEAHVEDGWALCMAGHGVVPRSFDPQASLVQDQALMAEFQRQLHAIAVEVRGMETHAQALARIRSSGR